MSLLKPPPKDPPTAYLVEKHPYPAFRFFRTCPHAQTFTAWSHTRGSEVLFALPCARWSCRLCAEKKIKRLACTVHLAEPNRLLTLTVDPSLHVSPENAWRATRRQVPVLIRDLRKDRGEIEYLRVTEITAAGWPHYHMLIRSGYLPHAVVQKKWSKLTGAVIVDIRQVKRSFSAYKYLVKYLSKLHRLEWTDRHVSLSKNFSPSQKWKHPEDLQLLSTSLENVHPAYLVAEQYVGWLVKEFKPNAYLLIPPDFPVEPPTHTEVLARYCVPNPDHNKYGRVEDTF